MDGPISFFLFFCLVVPFVLMNMTADRRERQKANEELQALLKENNDLLRDLLVRIKSS